MRARLVGWVLLAAAVSACATPSVVETASVPPDAAAWRKIDDSVRKVETLEGLEAVARDIPWSRNIQLALMNGYLEAGRKADAYMSINRLIEGGNTFTPTGEKAIVALFDGAERTRLAELFASDPAPLVASGIAAEISRDVELVESVALDRKSGRMFAGSVVSQGLVERAADGRWSRVPLANAGSIGGMVVDEQRRILWVASGIYDETPRPEGAFSGLIGIGLDDGSERRITGPQGSTPSDIMLAADGTLYAADPVHGAIYRAGPGAKELSLLVGPGTFRSPQGMVDVGDRVLVSDWGYGLALIDPATGRIWRVDPARPLLLDGIDGMWRHGDEIVAVQNGARPAQIVAFNLSPDGTRITRWRVLERGVPGWTEPASGTLSGGELLYVGTGQWDSYAKGGVPKDGRQAEPTQIRRLDLREKADLPPKKRG